MKIEEIIINNNLFIKTTPENGFVLHKIGTDEYYNDAIDLPSSNFQYEEVKNTEELSEDFENLLTEEIEKTLDAKE